MKKILIFATKLLVMFAIMSIVSWGVDFYPFQEITARFSTDSVNLLGLPAEMDGIMITVGEKNFLVSEDCTSWKGLFFLMSLIVATGSTAKKKLEGLAIGLPVLYSLNLLRIVTLIFFTVRYGPAAYEFIHGFLWHSTMVIAVLALWLQWMRRTKFITDE